MGITLCECGHGIERVEHFLLERPIPKEPRKLVCLCEYIICFLYIWFGFLHSYVLADTFVLAVLFSNMHTFYIFAGLTSCSSVYLYACSHEDLIEYLYAGLCDVTIWTELKVEAKAE